MESPPSAYPQILGISIYYIFGLSLIYERE